MSAPHLKNIALAGASGVTGTPIIKHLLEAGRHNILALTRSSSKAWFPNGVKATEVDYESKASLAAALNGQDILLLCLSIATAPGVEKRLVDAAAEAGVQWIVPNEWSPDYLKHPAVAKDMLSASQCAETRRYIEESGMLWTAQCSGVWYEHSLVGPQNFAFELDKKKVIFFDDGKTAITTSTWDQCGQSESEWTIEHELAEERFKRGLQMFKEGDPLGALISVYGRLFMSDGAGDERARSENEQLGLPKEDLDEATKRAVKMIEEGYVYNPFK